MEESDLKEKSFPSGATVFKAGDEADYAYLIGKGTVDIVSNSGKVLDTLERGDLFGEMALLDDTVRSATVSLEDSDLLTYALMRMLTKRLRHTDSEVA